MRPRTLHSLAAVAILAALFARPTQAQQAQKPADDSAKATPAAHAGAPSATAGSTSTTPAARPAATGLQPQLPNQRPADQSGVTMFEAPKSDTIPFNGLALAWGAAFTQDFQGLVHQNSATPVMVAGVNTNQLIGIGNGFTTAMANLGLSAQLAKGIRVDLTTYLSTRHHQDTWVKGGYLQIDDSPFDVPVLNAAMKNLTIRIGQFEENYGDAHFRRTDAGNGMDNPFVGNLIMDAFTTEIGGDLTYKRNGYLAMFGMTGGASSGQVTAPGKHEPAYLGKLGVDKQLNSHLRVRLTASTYNDAKSTSNVLYSGDRGGSHYFDILGNTTSTETGNAWSGNIQPGFSNHVEAYAINPFVKCRGLEVFGNFETATGAAATETKDRTWRQNSGDVVYRFLPNERAYVAARFNTANGEIVGGTEDVNVQRTQFGFGLFLTKNVLAKAEYINQTYNHYALTNLLNGARFHGFMFEGAVGF